MCDMGYKRNFTDADVRFVCLAALTKMLLNATDREFIVYELWRRRKAAGFVDMPAYGFMFQSNDYLEARALELLGSQTRG